MGLYVLLVEDNPDHALLAKRSLERDDRIERVEVCEDAFAALAVMRDEQVRRPDAVVVDIRLPGISGLELLDSIKGDPRTAGVPVIVVSTSAPEHEVRSAIRRGARAYMSKPIRAGELIANLRRPDRVPRELT